MILKVLFTREQLSAIGRSDEMADIWFPNYPNAKNMAEKLIAAMTLSAALRRMTDSVRGMPISDRISAEPDIPDTVIRDLIEGRGEAFKFVKEEPMPLFSSCVTVVLMKPETMKKTET